MPGKRLSIFLLWSQAGRQIDSRGGFNGGLGNGCFFKALTELDIIFQDNNKTLQRFSGGHVLLFLLLLLFLYLILPLHLHFVFLATVGSTVRGFSTNPRSASGITSSLVLSLFTNATIMRRVKVQLHETITEFTKKKFTERRRATKKTTTR